MEEADFPNYGENGSKKEGIKDIESKGQKPCNLQDKLDNAIVKTEIKMEDDDDDDDDDYIVDSASEKGSIDEDGDLTDIIEKNGQERCNLQGVLDNEIEKSEIKMEDDGIIDCSTENISRDEEGSNFTVRTERNGQEPCNSEAVFDDTIVKSEIKMEEDDIIDCPTENSSRDEEGGNFTVGTERNGQEPCHLEDVFDNTTVKSKIKTEEVDIIDCPTENSSRDEEGSNFTLETERNEQLPCNLEAVLHDIIVKSEIKMEEDDVIDCPTENCSKDEEVSEGVQTETNEQNSGAREVQTENVIAKNNIRMEDYVLRDTVIQFGRALRSPLLLNETVPEHVGGKLNARTDEMPTERETTENSWTKLDNAIFKDGILIDNTNVIHSGLIQKSSQLNILNKNIKIVDTRKTGQETFECPENKMRNLVEKEIITTDDIFLSDSAFECSENKMRNLVEKEIITTDDIFLFDSAFECPENKMRNLVEKEIITDDIFLFDSAFECPENKMRNLVEKEIITTDDIFLFDSAIQPGTNTNSETNENLSNKEKRLASSPSPETELNNPIPKAKDTMEDAHLQVSALRIHFNNRPVTYEVLRTVKNGHEPLQDPEVESDHVFVRKKTVKVDNIGNNGQEPCQGPGIETDINIMMRCSVSLERLRSIEKYCQEPFEYPIGVSPTLRCQQSGLIQVQTNDMSAQMKDQSLIDSQADKTTDNNDFLFINIGVLDNKPEPVHAEMDGQDPLTCINMYENDTLSSSDVEFVDSKEVQDKIVSTEKDLHDPNQKIEIAHNNYKCNLCDKTFILKSKYQVHLLYHGNMKCLKCHRMFDSGVTLKNHMQKNHKNKLNKHLSIHMDKNVHNCSVCHKSFIDHKSLLNHKLIHQFINSYKCIHCNKSYENIVQLNKHLLTHDAGPVESDSKEKAWPDEEVSTEEFQDLSDECIDVDEDFSDEDNQPLSVLAKHNPIKYKVKNKAGSGKPVSTELEFQDILTENNGHNPSENRIQNKKVHVLNTEVLTDVKCQNLRDKCGNVNQHISVLIETNRNNRSMNKEVTEEWSARSDEVFNDTEIHQNLNKDKNVSESANYEKENNGFLFINLGVLINKLLNQTIPDNKPDPVGAEMDGQGPLTCIERYDDILSSSETHDARPVESHNKEKAWPDKEVSIEEFQDLSDECIINVDDEDDQPLSVLVKQNPLKYKVKNTTGSGKQVSTELESKPVDSEMDGQGPLTCIDIYDDDTLSSSDVEFVNSTELQDKVVSTEKDLHVPNQKIEIAHKNYKCNVCDETFKLKSECQVHLLYHTIGNTNIKCLLCSRIFDTCVALQNHMQTKHNENPPQRKKQLSVYTDKNVHNCSVCHKSFTDHKSLLNHKLIHQFTNSYKCIHCNKSYGTIVDLNKHLLTHVARAVESDNKGKAWSDEEVSTEEFQDLSDECIDVDKDFSDEDDQPLSFLTKQKKKLDEKEFNDAEFHQDLNTDKNVSESANHQQNYMCVGCGDMFTNTEELEKHEITHKKYECDLCENVFNQYSKYEQHFMYHTNGDKLKCLHCKMRFDSGLTLKCHMQTRNCKQCRKCLPSSADLEKHMQFIHSGIHPYKCTKCGQGFLLPEELDKHSLSHIYKKLYTCKVCHKSFHSKDTLSDHFRRHIDKVYKCTKCSETFVSQRNLKSHLFLHSGVKNYKCKICSKAFAQSWIFRTHLNRHAGIQPHKCPLCDKRFSRIKGVKRHLVIIHYGKKEHKCIHCNECFALYPDLKRHYAIHNDPRPAKCKECPQSFVLLHHLRTHMLSHSGVKPHQCVQCGSSFRLPHHLRNHLLTHSAKKRPKRK